MLLVIDVGNTNIVFGVYDGDELKNTFRLTTKKARTPDEFGMDIHHFLQYFGVNPEDLNAAILVSVVPDSVDALCEGVRKYLGANPLIVGPGTKTGIKILTGYPQEIGADRIVDAAGAYYIYGGPVLVIDFGTATTYDLITEDGGFKAGITAPGIRGSAASLWTNAAKLPEFEIRKPESILAKETISSLQAGLVYGYIGSAEYIIRQVKKESGYDNLKVVATGGLGRIIFNETEEIQVYDPDLTLKGLRIIYEKNQQR